MNDRGLWDNIDNLRLICERLQEEVNVLVSTVKQLKEKVEALEHEQEYPKMERRRG